VLHTQLTQALPLCAALSAATVPIMPESAAADADGGAARVPLLSICSAWLLPAASGSGSALAIGSNPTARRRLMPLLLCALAHTPRSFPLAPHSLAALRVSAAMEDATEEELQVN